MGNWNIDIQGCGSHHNSVHEDGTPSVPEDAEKMTKKFVEELKNKGHGIDSATFTQTGQVDDLLEEVVK